MMAKISAVVPLAILLYLAASVAAKSTDREETETTDFGQDIEVVKFRHFSTDKDELICFILIENIQSGAVPDDGSVETALLN
jgi:hypothetical protein